MILLTRKVQMIVAFTLIGAVMLKAGDALWQATKERQRYAPSKDVIDLSYKNCAMASTTDAAKGKACHEAVSAEIEKKTAEARKKAGDAFRNRLFSWHIG